MPTVFTCFPQMSHCPSNIAYFSLFKQSKDYMNIYHKYGDIMKMHNTHYGRIGQTLKTNDSITPPPPITWLDAHRVCPYPGGQILFIPDAFEPFEHSSPCDIGWLYRLYFNAWQWRYLVKMSLVYLSNSSNERVHKFYGSAFIFAEFVLEISRRHTLV